jgi:hypothetical protein
MTSGFWMRRHVLERESIEKLSKMAEDPCAICGGRLIRGEVNNSLYCERCGNVPPTWFPPVESRSREILLL